MQVSGSNSHVHSANQTKKKPQVKQAQNHQPPIQLSPAGGNNPNPQKTGLNLTA